MADKGRHLPWVEGSMIYKVWYKELAIPSPQTTSSNFFSAVFETCSFLTADFLDRCPCCSFGRRPIGKKRAPLGVCLCNNRNWCVKIYSDPTVCVPLAADLNNLVSSAGPDAGVECYFYNNPGCNLDAGFIRIAYPGVADLSVTPVNGPPGSTANYEDKFSSYRCHAI